MTWHRYWSLWVWTKANLKPWRQPESVKRQFSFAINHVYDCPSLTTRIIKEAIKLWQLRRSFLLRVSPSSYFQTKFSKLYFLKPPSSTLPIGTVHRQGSYTTFTFYRPFVDDPGKFCCPEFITAFAWLTAGAIDPVCSFCISYHFMVISVRRLLFTSLELEQGFAILLDCCISIASTSPICEYLNLPCIWAMKTPLGNIIGVTASWKLQTPQPWVSKS